MLCTCTRELSRGFYGEAVIVLSVFFFFKLKLYFSSVISIFWEDIRVLTRIQQHTHKQTICLTFKQVRNQVNIYRRIAGQLFLELHSFVKYFI